MSKMDCSVGFPLSARKLRNPLSTNPFRQIFQQCNPTAKVFQFLFFNLVILVVTRVDVRFFEKDK
jgi:hypothetical protein